MVYVADLRVEGTKELFMAPLDSSGGSLRLSPDLVAGGDVLDPALAPGGMRVVYLADQDTD